MMTVPRLLAIAGGLLLAGLGGCDRPLLRSVYPDITFTHLEPFRLDVASVEIVEAYVPPLRDPNVEHLSPRPPAKVMRRWVKDRLRAVGDSGIVRVTIEDAHIIGTALDVNQTFKAMFTTEQAARYDARAAMTVEVLDERRIVRASANAEARRSRTTAEGITLAQRDEVLFELTEALVSDLDAELTPNIERFLAAYLR